MLSSFYKENNGVRDHVMFRHFLLCFCLYYTMLHFCNVPSDFIDWKDLLLVSLSYYTVKHEALFLARSARYTFHLADLEQNMKMTDRLFLLPCTSVLLIASKWSSFSLFSNCLKVQ